MTSKPKNEPKNLHLLIDADARLAAAAGGMARFFADAAGLEKDAIAQLESAVIAACKEAFEHLTPEHAQLDVTVARFRDRLEVAVSHEGEAAPAVGLDMRWNHVRVAGVDRIQHETHGEEVVTRLTKFLGKVAPRV